MELTGFNLPLAVAVFVATDIDDLLLLALCFANPQLHKSAIVAGQFAGIGALVLISALAAAFAVILPPGWVALLGLVPLVMGLLALRGGDAHDDDDDVAAATTEQSRSLRWSAQMLAVASLTVANGGDNLGVYIPLFAGAPQLIAAFALIFGLLTALWCVAGYLLVHNRLLGDRMRQVGQRVLPFVLILLGIVILADARALLPLL
jgi:cadmium resistance protein CadD (predicted permease)